MAESEEKELNRPVTDIGIAEIARLIVQWEVLAPYVDLNEAEQEEIKGDNSTVILQKIGFLRKWRSKNGDSATYQRLIQAAKKSNNVQLAESIKKLCLGRCDT